jgi:hypothetical protein
VTKRAADLFGNSSRKVSRMTNMPTSELAPKSIAVNPMSDHSIFHYKNTESG